MSSPDPKSTDVIIALGSNVAGTWGTPEQAILIAMQKIGEGGLIVKNAADLVLSVARGGGRQPTFLNTVIIVEARQSPARLLRFLKALERASGRRLGRRWGPRSLDIDIVAQAGARRTQGSAKRPQGQLILPHPHMHERAFVLAPLHQIAPHWHHPILHRSVDQLLAQRFVQQQLKDVKRLDGTAKRLLDAAMTGRQRSNRQLACP